MPAAEDPYASRYGCLQNTPLYCDQPQKTAQEFPGAKYCLKCGFPALLPEKAEIRGARGTYRIIKFVRTQGLGRIYQAVKVNDNAPTVLKEYLLPDRCFNTQEANQRKEVFTRVAGVSPADSQVRDFRVVTPWEGIAEQQAERCYLVTSGTIATAPTLQHYLKDNGAMTAVQVREALSQILQTLQFLHSQKLRLPSGQVRQGLAHGNLSLDNLLITDNFYIYLSDLASWENLFLPPPADIAIPEPIQDLKALGYIGFYLWNGQTVDANTGYPLNPRDAHQWPQTDPPLREFLYRLLGFALEQDYVPFTTAEEARQVLLQLPSAEQGSGSGAIALDEEAEQRRRRWWLWLLLALAFLLVGGLLWLLWFSQSKPKLQLSAFDRLVPSFNDVNGLQAGTYPYTSENNGSWKAALEQKPVSDDKLRAILRQPKPSVAAYFEHQPLASPLRPPLQALLDHKGNNPINFALTSLVDQLPDSLESTTIAYDGLLVFVPFTKQAQNLPEALQGQMTLEQLRKIFTGEVQSWHELVPSLPPTLKITAYRPTEPEADQLFQQLVLNNPPELVGKFQRIPQRHTYDILNDIKLAEEKGQLANEGTISFGTLLQTWNQCKGYPLAIVAENNPPIQPLRRLEGDKPITITDDICDKRNYLDGDVFTSKRYPLGYPLVIAYPKDNNSPGYTSGPMFANVLKTKQGQYLLNKVGLIPLQPIPREYQPPQMTIQK
jgi:hypothetical protein